MGIKVNPTGKFKRTEDKEVAFQCPLSMEAGLQVIADPGNTVKVIPVNKSGCVPLVTAGAETRTLAVPTQFGQILVLSLMTDGGDCVVTVADPHIDGTYNTITFNDVGDTVTLIAGKSGSGYVWRLLSNVGATLSHV